MVATAFVYGKELAIDLYGALRLSRCFKRIQQKIQEGAFAFL
jgi:hypothetical protein